MRQLDLFTTLFDTPPSNKTNGEKQPVVKKEVNASQVSRDEETPFSLVELAEEALGSTAFNGNDENLKAETFNLNITIREEKEAAIFPQNEIFTDKLREVTHVEELQIAISSGEVKKTGDEAETVEQIQKETNFPKPERNGAVIFDDGKISVKVKSKPVSDGALTTVPVADDVDTIIPISDEADTTTVPVTDESDTTVPVTPAADIEEKVRKEPQKRGRKPIKEIEAEADLIEVPDDEVLFQKQYYPISEVAKWFRVNTSLLRFWENEFDILKPRKNRKGDRLFRPEDVKSLQLIYQLLRQRKYTIEGAKEYIKTNRKKADAELQLTNTLQKFRSFLLDLKANL